MNKSSNQAEILSIPNKIKLKLFKHLTKPYNIKIVGYKKIQIKYQVPIIELSNRIRLWTLMSEIY